MISVIIPHYLGLLDQVTRAVHDDLKKRDYEIIIIDDNSPDSIPEGIKYDKLIKHTKNIGYTKACNRGIKESNGDLILLLNSDAIVKHGCIDELVRLIQIKKDIGIVAAREYSPKRKTYFNLIDNWTNNTVFKTQPDFKEVVWVPFGCVLIKRQVFNSVGLMNEAIFLAWSDLEYCRRARRAGWRSLHALNAVVYHDRGMSENVVNPFSDRLIYWEV